MLVPFLSAACSLAVASPHSVASRHATHVTQRARYITACANEDGPDPEEWRAFRAKLVSGGLKLTEDEDGGGAIQEPDVSAADEEAKKAPTSVAPKNEELLKEQNEELWKEYYGGAWAHVSPGPEAGGLVCRLPLPIQITKRMRDQPGDTWGDKMRERLQKELPTTAASDGDSGDDDEASRLLEQFSSNTMYTYRLAEGLVSDALREIAAKADNGRISIDRVDADQRELLTM